MTYFAVIVFYCCLTNCATIIHGSKQNVVIVSEPRIANIQIDGIDAGRTPLVVKLSRRNKHFVKIDLDGYTPYEITLHRNISGWFFGNILLGGIVGIAVDAATGAIYNLSPKDIYGDLNAASTSLKKTEKELYVTVVLKPNAEWNKVGQLEK